MNTTQPFEEPVFKGREHALFLTQKAKDYLAANPPVDWLKKIRGEMHYPECWNTAAYPTLFHAIYALASCSECASKREAVEPLADRGLPMSDIKAGMRLKCTLAINGPVILVEEITKKGFKYSHPPVNYGYRIGFSSGGECWGIDGYSFYTQIDGGKS